MRAQDIIQAIDVERPQRLLAIVDLGAKECAQLGRGDEPGGMEVGRGSAGQPGGEPVVEVLFAGLDLGDGLRGCFFFCDGVLSVVSLVLSLLLLGLDWGQMWLYDLSCVYAGCKTRDSKTLKTPKTRLNGKDMVLELSYGGRRAVVAGGRGLLGVVRSGNCRGRRGGGSGGLRFGRCRSAVLRFGVRPRSLGVGWRRRSWRGHRGR